MPARPPPPPPPKRASTTGRDRPSREPSQTVSRQADWGRELDITSVRPSDYEHFVRIDADGHVLQAHGSATRLASLSAYSCNLADAIGQLLDLGTVRSVEATFAGGLLLSVREPDGSIVGLKPYAPAESGRIQVGRR